MVRDPELIQIKCRNRPDRDQGIWPVLDAGCPRSSMLGGRLGQPGLYAYVNHNLIEAFALGAAAHVQVEGDWNNDLMTQVFPPTDLS